MKSNGNESRSEQLNQVVAEYFAAIESGDSPNRDGIIHQHPELADDLRSFFASHDRVKEAAQPEPEEATLL